MASKSWTPPPASHRQLLTRAPRSSDPFGSTTSFSLALAWASGPYGPDMARLERKSVGARCMYRTWNKARTGTFTWRWHQQVILTKLQLLKNLGARNDQLRDSTKNALRSAPASVAELQELTRSVGLHARIRGFEKPDHYRTHPRFYYQWTTMPYDSTPSVKLQMTTSAPYQM